MEIRRGYGKSTKFDGAAVYAIDTYSLYDAGIDLVLEARSTIRTWERNCDPLYHWRHNDRDRQCECD